jgi:GTP-binding protein
VARTSAAPGKTRLANVYRIARGAGTPFYLVDLPGYGFARGGPGGDDGLIRAATEYFGGGRGGAVVLLVDSRHPGLDNDLDAWRWLRDTVETPALVATKIDKLARGERIRAMREMESVFEHSVLPVSAVTGEGLDELWKLIDRLANSQTPQPRRRDSRPNPRATAPHPLAKTRRPPHRPKR